MKKEIELLSNFNLDLLYNFLGNEINKKKYILKKPQYGEFYEKAFKIINSREKKYLSKKYDFNNVICEPPGIKNDKLTKEKDYTKIKISGTYDWLPKKLSKLSEKQTNYLSSKFKIISVDDHLSSCSLIEENFKAGFKLKLLEMLFFGDIIFSMIDLSDEIKALGLDSSFFINISKIEEVNLNSIDLNLVDIVSKKNQERLLNHYKWNHIAKRIMSEIKL